MDGGPCLRVSQCHVQQFRRCLQTRAALDSKNKTERTSGNKLEKILQELIESHGERWTEELRADLPHSFQRHGDLLLLKDNCFSLLVWKNIDPVE
ncbi:hypothetical protein NQZ68_040534 [Dissostichus eleginoides]|nr:hypothetical protein NQZ68_040534 [Dissostichus eleginoides]